ncbi:MAG: DUF2341 domain-containing protein, partial [Methanosarcinales archaeon]
MSILKKLLKITKDIKIPVALAIFLFASVGVACANLDGWQYHKTISVKDNSGNTLTDYQILVNLSSADFPTEAQSDGSDLRFTNASGNQLNYWIESYDATNKEAKIWVKVPRIPANGVTTLQMHYGNTSASAVSDGNATFALFNVTGIKAFWHFDEDFWNGTTGEVKDETGVNNGAAKNGANTIADGKFGRAGSFDESNDYVDVPDLMSQPGYTIAAWVKPKDVSNAYIYYFGPKIGCNPSKTSINLNNDKFRVNIGCSHDNLYSDTLSTNTWYFVVLTQTEDYDYSLYVNGVLQDGPRDIRNGYSLTEGNEMIGSGWSGGIQKGYFNGTIDEVRIYNRALSADEISTIYNNYMEKMGSYYNVRKYASPEPTVTINAPLTLIYNGDFEIIDPLDSSNPDGWTLEVGGRNYLGNSLYKNVESEYYYSGSHSIKFNLDGYSNQYAYGTIKSPLINTVQGNLCW